MIGLTKKMKEFFRDMTKHGIESGIEIANLAEQIHPGAMTFVPLYRSCLVIYPPLDGGVTIIAYHDPCWMGHDKRTIENIEKFKTVYYVQGQRSGPDFHILRHINSWQDVGYIHTEMMPRLHHESIIAGEKELAKIRAWWYQPWLWIAYRNPIARKYHGWADRRRFDKGEE